MHILLLALHSPAAAVGSSVLPGRCPPFSLPAETLYGVKERAENTSSGSKINSRRRGVRGKRGMKGERRRAKEKNFLQEEDERTSNS